MKSKNRRSFALLLTPLLVPIGLFLVGQVRLKPVFSAPVSARVTVSRYNPFHRIAGPVYFERLESIQEPAVLWQQMQQVFRKDELAAVGSGLMRLGANAEEARNHHQESFKVLGVPQITLNDPSFQTFGQIRGAYMKIYLWADGHGGSVMELWIMDPF